jgi:hypothetical protein
VGSSVMFSVSYPDPAGETRTKTTSRQISITTEIMSDAQKDRFHVISTLRTWTWDSFVQRREFEGKINIGVWTALAALIGILLSRGISIAHGVAFVKWGSVAFVVALTSLHVYYIRGLEKAQRLDRNSVHEYDELLEDEFGPFLSDSLKDARKGDKARRGFLKSYSHSFEVGLTLLLGLCIVAIAFSL